MTLASSYRKRPSSLSERKSPSRQGTDGDWIRYVQMYREYDGKVDAFGVGGAEFYLLVNGRRYYWRQIRQVRQAVLRHDPSV